MANCHKKASQMKTQMYAKSGDRLFYLDNLRIYLTFLVILHHAIYGYRPRPEFQKIVGVTSWLTGAKDNFDIRVHVEDSQHPITKGLKDFTIRDEVYQGAKLDPRVHVLLTTDQPANEKAIAWVHTYRKSPVCYFQLGHDQKAYTQPEFPTILARAIRGSAGRLKP